MCAQPGDAAAGRALQRSMARWGRPASLHDDQHSVAADAPLEVSSVNCDVLAIGDHGRHKVTTDLGDLVVRVDVVALLAASPTSRWRSDSDWQHRTTMLQDAISRPPRGEPSPTTTCSPPSGRRRPP